MDQASALIHFHLKEDPDKMTEEEWATAFARVTYAIKQENKKWQKG